MTVVQDTAARNGTGGRPRTAFGVSLPGLDVTANPVGLRFESELSLPAWCRLGSHVAQLGTAAAWWIGDWLVYGQDRYQDRYRRSMAEHALDYQTLRNYAWVSRHVRLPQRRRSLSFQHHAEIARLPAEQQTSWLRAAEENSWSRNALRDQLRGRPGRVRPVTLRIDAPPQRKQRWAEAAEAAGQSLTAWVISRLDEATGA
ncbi:MULTISPECIES: LmbU family transcriptional regulator [Amycolatopsis]|uniref:LmbU family transcriptional regulator n=1 Tax=Amycolatopsis albidoflavus TaxID=102226 RepID=A0ABW5I0A3_9PSEU